MTRNLKDKAKIFILSAPSGCGKTTLARKLIDGNLGLVHSVSVTTRPPRPSEKDGVDYHFVTKEVFDEMAGDSEFLEHEENFGSFYGTPKKAVEGYLRKGKSVLLSIDVKGAMKVRKAYPKKSVLIFILPPSITALKRRLKSRRSDGAAEISKRINFATHELAYKDRYDYNVTNDRLDRAYRKLKNIIMSEMCVCG
jgi:guanylate kinase